MFFPGYSAGGREVPGPGSDVGSCFLTSYGLGVSQGGQFLAA